MARSGSYDFKVTQQDVINAALRVIFGLGGKRPPTTNAQREQANGQQALNMMLKAWQARNVGLWKNAEIIVFLAEDEYSYDLGPTGDHAAESIVETEISTAGSETDTTLTVDSITGISDADNIGIELDDGSLQWTTVNGTPAASTITITAALTDDVAVDNNVYTYTTIIQRPLTITEGRLYRDDGTETPLEIINRDEYMNLANKSSTGPANQVYYDPQLDNGKLYVWPACSDVAEYLKLTARLPVQDMEDSDHNFDFPQEWFEAIKLNLAYKLSPEYEGLDLNNRMYMKGLADEALDLAMAFDFDYGSVHIGVDNSESNY
jgi:hypothetical protein